MSIKTTTIIFVGLPTIVCDLRQFLGSSLSSDNQGIVSEANGSFRPLSLSPLVLSP